jgi:hypothetical protein
LACVSPSTSGRPLALRGAPADGPTAYSLVVTLEAALSLGRLERTQLTLRAYELTSQTRLRFCGSRVTDAAQIDRVANELAAGPHLLVRIRALRERHGRWVGQADASVSQAALV